MRGALTGSEGEKRDGKKKLSCPSSHLFRQAKKGRLSASRKGGVDVTLRAEHTYYERAPGGGSSPFPERQKEALCCI